MRITAAAAVLAGAVFAGGCLQRPAGVPAPQRTLFREGERLMGAGLYGEALGTFEAFRGRYPGSTLADDALFLSGFILVCEGNGQRNYDAALRLFIRLEEDYAESEWLAEARTWRLVLERVRYLGAERGFRAAGGGTGPGADEKAQALERTLVEVRRTLATVTADRDRLQAENRKLTDVLHKLEALDR